MTDAPVTFVALHGFASSPRSKKNEHFAARFAARGIPLARPDLNQPSFAKLSFAAMLGEVERTWRAGGERPLRMIGSSLGGYVAALFAAAHPERVDRLVLLCPAFDLRGRWQGVVAPARLAEWKARGVLAFDDATGRPVDVHYAFFEEGAAIEPLPRVTCPTGIVHGRGDETVPFAQSEAYAASTPAVRRLVAVDDDHHLLRSLDAIDGVIDELFFSDSSGREGAR
ncbi:MAG: YqiA/YcfP family alpha/beta fold hydrolase [Sandaracinus sp.]